MNLHLNEQEAQLMKNVLHALYKTFRREPGLNIGSCSCTNIYPEDLKVLIDLHDRMMSIKDEPENVWVFTAEQAWDGEAADVVVKTFPTEAAAVKYLHDFLLDDGGDESIRDYVKRKGWEVEIDEPELYRAYDDGRYSTDHIELTITKCEINEN